MCVLQGRTPRARGEPAEQYARQGAPHVAVLQRHHRPQQREQIRTGLLTGSAQVHVLGGNSSFIINKQTSITFDDRKINDKRH